MTTTIIIVVCSIFVLIMVYVLKFACKLDGGVVKEQLGASGNTVTKIKFNFMRGAYEVEYKDRDGDEHHAFVVSYPFAIAQDDIVEYSPTSPKRSKDAIVAENQKLREEIDRLKKST